MASSDVARRCLIPYNLGNRIHFFEHSQKLQDVVRMPCHVFQNVRAPYEYTLVNKRNLYLTSVAYILILGYRTIK